MNKVAKGMWNGFALWSMVDGLQPKRVPDVSILKKVKNMKRKKKNKMVDRSRKKNRK